MLKTKINQVLLFACFLLSAVNCFGLRIFYNYEVAGNYVFASVEPVFVYLIKFLSVVTLFCGYCILIRSLHSFGMKKSAALFAAICVSYLIQYIAAAVATAVTSVTSPATWKAFLLYTASDWLFNIILLAVTGLIALLILRRSVRKPQKAFPRSLIAAAILYAVVNTGMNAVTTVQLLLEYGAPINLNEVFTLISPYLETLIFAAIGFCVMLLLKNYFEPETEKRKKS